MKIPAKHSISLSALLMVFLACSIPFTALGRLAREEELSRVFKKQRLTTSFGKGDRRTDTYEFDLEVRRIEAVAASTTQQVIYNSRTQKAFIEEAYTEVDGHRFPVTPAQIETRAALDNQGFDKIMTKTLAFPHVKPGAVLHWKVRLESNEESVPGLKSVFSRMSSEATDEFSFELTAPFKPNLFVHDPYNELEVKRETISGKHRLMISRKSKFRRIFLEEENPYTTLGHETFFIASNLSQWTEMPRAYLTEWEHRISEKMSSAFLEPAIKEIRDLPEDQRVAGIAAFVSREIHYFGDWRSVRGGHLPRHPGEIVATRYGDCKDLSLVTVAIARALGYKANVALAWRGHGDSASPLGYRIPSELAFNHAIARVEKDDKVYWLDATNFAHVPSYVPGDIAGRPAFVIDPAHPKLDSIPMAAMEDGGLKSEIQVKLGTEDSAVYKGSMRFQGSSSFWFAQDQLLRPPAEMAFGVARLLAGGSAEILKHQIDLPEAKRRAPLSQTLTFEVNIRGFVLPTTDGRGILIPRPGRADSVMVKLTDRESDLLVGDTGKSESRIVFSGERIRGSELLDCELKRKEFEFSRKVYQSKEGIVVEQSFGNKVPVIPIETLRDPQYIDDQHKLRACFEKAAIILK